MTDTIPNRTTLSETELIGLGVHWPDITHWSPRSTEWGTANATFFVGDGDRYILKIYGDKNPQQLQFEHKVLLHLNQCKLSFAVSSSCRTSPGEFVVPVASADSRLQASVYEVVPGQSRKRGNEKETFLIGAAMGELHHALSTSSLTRSDAVLPPWGDLDRIHPLVPSPHTVTTELGMAAHVVAETERIVQITSAAIPSLMVALSSQVVHADYVQPNVLFDGAKISGVIDFEFATWDLRAFDLIASLYHYCLSPWTNEPRWALIEAFLRGYSSKETLTPDELKALPMLLRWQRLSCLVYWTGMYRQGLATHESLVAAAEENILLEGWIHSFGNDLVERSQGIVSPSLCSKQQL